MFASWTRCGVAVVLIVTVCGCSMTQKEQASMTAGSMQQTNAELMKVADQIDVTLAALNDLAENPQSNLKPQYETFAAAVAGLQTQADITKKRAEEMRAQGAAYFDAWNYDSDAPVSPKVKASYDKIAQESAKARDAFNPFLVSLADIKKLVGMDITGTGVNLIQDLVKKANAEAQDVKASIQAVLTEVDTVSKLIAPAKTN
jgi:hypothetical protein